MLSMVRSSKTREPAPSGICGALGPPGVVIDSSSRLYFCIERLACIAAPALSPDRTWPACPRTWDASESPILSALSCAMSTFYANVPDRPSRAAGSRRCKWLLVAAVNRLCDFYAVCRPPYFQLELTLPHLMLLLRRDAARLHALQSLSSRAND